MKLKSSLSTRQERDNTMQMNEHSCYIRLEAIPKHQQTSEKQRSSVAAKTEGKQQKIKNLYFLLLFLPPVWFLRMVTHLHCSTLANLLLEPNTVLGPINLQTNPNESVSNNHEHFRFKQAEHPGDNLCDEPLTVKQQ